MSSQYSGFSTDPPELSTFNFPNCKTTLIVWLMYVHRLIMFITSVYMLETCVDMALLYDPIPVSHVYLIKLHVFSVDSCGEFAGPGTCVSMAASPFFEFFDAKGPS